MKRNGRRIMSFLMILVMIMGLLPIGALPASAGAATAVTLTDTAGVQTVLAADTETATYTYDADTATLTLNGYTGRRIFANGAMNLHLKGTNTITMADIEGEDGYGIRVMDGGAIGNLTISADDGATLNINGTDLTRTAMGFYAAPIIKNGTININITAIGSGVTYGVYGILEFAKEQTKPAALNVRVENTTGNNSVTAIGNGSLKIEDCSNEITINAEAYNDDYYAWACDSSLSISNSAPKISFKASAPNGEAYHSMAFSRSIDALSLNEGGKITFDGLVSCYEPDYSTNLHTAFTTPADNAYFWQVDKTVDPYSNYYFLKDATGAALNKAVLEYVDETPALTWRGEGFFSVPEGKVGEYLSNQYFKNYITGASGYTPNHSYELDFEIIEGALPEGIALNRYHGYIAGTPTTPCPAGTITVKCTDHNNTTSDLTDDRSITFTIPYGAIKSDKPVTALNLNKEELILNKGDTASITVTPTPADASYPNISATPSNYTYLTVEDGEPVGGVTTVTVTAGTWAGAYSVAIKALDTGLNKTLNVYVKEAKPTITYDAEDSALCGFYSGASYRISAEGVADYEFDSDGSDLPMQAQWIDKTLTIICLSDENAKCNSDPCILGVDAYALTVTKGSGSGSYPAGSICRIEAEAPAEGYRFTGWSGTEGLTFRNETDKDDAIIYIEMPERDLTIEATYQLITYELAFSNLYGGSGEMASMTGGNTYTLPDCTFTPPAGKEFSHWIIGGQQKQPGESVTLTADAIAYASWKADTTTLFDITINHGEATVEDTPVTKAAQFTRVYIRADEPAAGSVFEKWVIEEGNVIISDPTAEETYFDMLYEDVVITATYHTHIGNMTFHQEEPSTCKEQGKKAYYECSCGNLYEDENAQRRIINFAVWGNLPLKTKHTLAKGLGPHECSVCHQLINPFTDVRYGNWSFEGIVYAYNKGYMTGTNKSGQPMTFSPDMKFTREQFVQLLFNMEGKKKSDYKGDTGFSDVPSDKWYSAAVKWAKAEGITTGIGGGKFGLGGEVTREQLAQFLKNYADYRGEDTSARADLSVYEDHEKISSWAKKSMRWAAAVGLLGNTSAGNTKKTISPKRVALRSEVAKITMSFDDFRS